MAIISTSTIIRSLSSLHLITAYYLLYDPAVIASHNLVVILSAAVGLPLPNADSPALALFGHSPANALLAAVLAFSALSDLAATSLPDEVSLIYFSSQTPIRLMFFFGLTAWSYSFRPGGILAGRAESEALAAENLLSGSLVRGHGIGNGIVFSWAFVQVIMYFWVFITLRDERKEVVAKDARRRGD